MEAMTRPGTEGRRAVNETLLREANDRFRHLYETSDLVGEHEFVCECGEADCTETVRLTLTAYESMRREGRYIVAAGHAPPERVLVVGADYVVVEGARADG
jgi:hypothetical protein